VEDFHKIWLLGIIGFHEESQNILNHPSIFFCRFIKLFWKLWWPSNDTGDHNRL